MRIAFHGRPGSFAEACRQVEEIAEGAVRAMQAEIEPNPKAFPCCINCGEFVVRNANAFPAQPTSIQAMIDEMGYSIEPEDVLDALHGVMPESECPAGVQTVRIRCARDIALHKGGSTLELACYQAAQRRRRGDDPNCVVIVTGAQGCNGGRVPAFRAAVLNSDKHYMPEKAGRLDCPVDRLGPGECACGLEVR